MPFDLMQLDVYHKGHSSLCTVMDAWELSQLQYNVYWFHSVSTVQSAQSQCWANRYNVEAKKPRKEGYGNPHVTLGHKVFYKTWSLKSIRDRKY